MEEKYDVVVVGGGAAGLNGALMLARSRRSVLVVDGGPPRNAPAHGVHGLLGHDGVPPAELLAKGREEVRRYGGEVVEAEVTAPTRRRRLQRRTGRRADRRGSAPAGDHRPGRRAP